MLGPYDRLQLVSELRPPEGFEFDRGFGTTYSLDLESMLIVPLSLVLMEFESQEDALANPEALLEGLRRMAGKLDIFCQRGRIKRPSEGFAQFAFLEEMLVEVQLRNREASFHPKVWLLRYRKDRKVLLRLLVLSRNLTFDKSWDAALVLDGLVRPDRQSSVQSNGRLVQFIEALTGHAGTAKSRVSAPLQSLAKDVLKTEFDVPTGFEGYTFWPLGIDSAFPNHVFQGPHGRFFAMSPFVTDLSSSRSKGVLDVLLGKRTSVANNVLVSRVEELDCLPADSIKAIKETTDIYVLDDGAVEAESAGDNAVPAGVPDVGTLSGLHAKVYVIENGAQVSIFTGSANATWSGWGRGGTLGNVEFMVELFGARQSVGVDALLGTSKTQEKGAQSLRNLLKPYNPHEKPVEIDADTEKVRETLRHARAALAAAAFQVEISEATEKNIYEATLVVPRDLDTEGADVWAWPIMLPQGRAQRIATKEKSGRLQYTALSIIALTRFWAFRIRARCGNVEHSEDFVLRLPVRGMPDGRTTALLAHMINNSERFLRYLQFLLLEDPSQPGASPRLRKARGTGANDDPASLASKIVFEDLVRAYSRNPDRLDRIEGLLSDLKKGGAGADVIPREFEEIWEPFRVLRASDRANRRD